MRTKKQPPAVTPDILRGRLFISVREYAALVGVPESTVYSLITSGKILGTVRIGNAVRIPVTAVTSLVA
jgi:excisionase family DNA binding protein